MLNYVKIENIYVIGSGKDSSHAWNLVKFDNGNYYVDTTWNQNAKSNKFFAKGTKDYVETEPTHISYTTKNTYLNYLYDLPTVPSDNYIHSGANVKDCSVIIASDSYFYNGTEKKPKLTIMYDDFHLVENEHYTVTYKNNVNAGMASVIITGIGIFTGTVIKTFEIKTASLLNLDTRITLSDTTLIYTSSALQPKVTVKIGDKLLIPNTDYVPTYVKNIEPGTAIVIIIGIGNYTDAIKTTFTIEKHVHSFVDREQTVTPTCIQKGSESKKCTVCGEIETREIKMIGHKFSAWKTTSFNLKNKTSTQTRKCSSAERRKLRRTRTQSSASQAEFTLHRPSRLCSSQIALSCRIARTLISKARTLQR